MSRNDSAALELANPLHGLFDPVAVIEGRQAQVSLASRARDEPID